MLSAEWLLPSVRQFVFLQIASLCEGLVANIAAVRLLTTVSLHVTFQIGSLVRMIYRRVCMCVLPSVLSAFTLPPSFLLLLPNGRKSRIKSVILHVYSSFYQDFYMSHGKKVRLEVPEDKTLAELEVKKRTSWRCQGMMH